LQEPIDYAAVGLIAGLEVHQQLLTERKMFCNCPAGLYTTDHDGEVLRHMRPTLSELGEYDGTALMEFKTRKNIVYLLHKTNVCTYEMDDTPPFLVNQDALDVAIEQCLMLGCDIVDEVHVARKQYLDGSIPTGFQRTAIVGVNGKLPFRGRELSITQVSVEEDSCREVTDQGHLVVWRTDRLGMPLIETVTGPDLRTPEEVVEAILLVGRVCRSTGHVRTGIGASRQDVNVSVRGGRRVEIKGVPKAGWALDLVHGEAVRQVNLLALRDELHSRGFRSAADLRIDHRNLTRQMQRAGLELLHSECWDTFVKANKRRLDFELGKGNFCVRAVRLRGLAGTLRWPTQPDHDFAHELAGRVRVIAGLDQQPILLHSEKWPDYRGSTRDLRRLKATLDCRPEDALVLVWGPKQDTLTAAEEIRLRYVDALDGIPNETRQPFADGSTDFERILPGPDRMYPDTDSPPSRVTRERVAGLRETLPPPPWEREERYGAVGLSRDLIHYLIRRNGAALVDEVVRQTGASLRTVGLFVGSRLKGLRRAGVAVDSISVERWCELFALALDAPVVLEAAEPLVRHMVAAPERAVAELADALGLGQVPAGWTEQVDAALDEPAVYQSESTLEQRQRYFMRRAMVGLRGRVPGREVAVRVREHLKRNAALAEQGGSR